MSMATMTGSVKKHKIKAKGEAMLSRSKAGNIGVLVFLLLMCSFMVLPVFYSVIQSFKPLDEIFAFPPKFFVKKPTLENYRTMFKLANNLWVPFSRYLFNSLSITIVGTTAYVLIAAMAAFPLAKVNFRGRSIISKLIVWSLLFSADVTAIPRYIVLSKGGMIDTVWAILLPTLSSTMGVFLMQQFIDASIPEATLEAAAIDGASTYRTFFSIVFPSVKPAWLTVTIFTFQMFWNMNPQSYIYSENLKQLPSILSSIAAGGIARTGAAAAVSVFMMILPIIVFIFSQSSIVTTMAHSGLK